MSSPLRAVVRLPAVCIRCGADKLGALVPCRACGHVPSGPDRAVAWLLSEHHLRPDELAVAAARVRAGELPEPSRALREQARVAMGAAPAIEAATAPLSPRQQAGILLANLLLTNLVGLAVWFGLRAVRPRAARQALVLTAPVAALTSAMWVAELLGVWSF